MAVGSWQLVGDSEDIIGYELFLSTDVNPKSYTSGISNTQISLTGIVPEFDLYWKIQAIDKYGRTYVSGTRLISPQDTDSDGLSDYIENTLCTNLNDSDSDDDGLTDSNEHYSLGTNPCSNDTDSDGMLDAWELSNNLDPLVNDADLDSDSDGTSNIEEFYAGSDPQNDASIPTSRTKVDFEDQTFGDYYWHGDGHTLWLIDSYANTGSYGARSGLITHSQYSVMETTINAVDGMVRFDAGISGESSDPFRFYIDGVEQLRLSGERAYATYAYPVSSGPLTLRWEYYKDSSVNTGQDRAWLDNIILPGIADSDGDGIADGLEYKEFGKLDGN